MSNYIIIDGGTTNLRTYLVLSGKITDTIKVQVTKKETLKNTVKTCIDSILLNNNLSSKNIDQIIASGMITCEQGIHLVPHIMAPAGIRELKDNICHIVIKEISEIPFSLIPGIKSSGNSINDFDIIRGEETELIGIMDNNETDTAYILPGSHSKCIIPDSSGRISDFTTFLSGEMISSIKENTILSKSLDYFDDIDETHLIMGYEMCDDVGLNQTLFKVRTMRNFFDVSGIELYSFFLGAVLHDEIKRISSFGPKKIVVAGKRQLKLPEYVLLKYLKQNVYCVDDKLCDIAAPMGALRIYEYR